MGKSDRAEVIYTGEGSRSSERKYISPDSMFFDEPESKQELKQGSSKGIPSRKAMFAISSS